MAVQSTLIFDPDRQCYRYWWACLPAIPKSREIVDWWSPGDDGRAPPYRRLKRVWNDPTWFKRPASDRYRRHEFSAPATGTHTMVQFWENWTLFHPSEWVPPLLREIGAPAGPGPWDACWSYEFEDAETGKLTDITLHLRDGVGHETLFAIEAKWNRDRLKRHPKVGLPDAHPDVYTTLPSYRSVVDRRMIYLVHEARRAAIETDVEQHATPDSSPWHILTWERLIRLQVELVARHSSRAVSGAIQSSIQAQADLPPMDQTAIGPWVGRLPDPEELIQLLDTKSNEDQLRNYLLGAQLFWACRSSSGPSQLPFSYLAEEPSFPELHDRVVHRRQHGERNPDIAEHTAPLWKLGPAVRTI
ncbi:MAG: hypothetical protein RLO46_13155 [Pseudomonadales bacterium]